MSHDTPHSQGTAVVIGASIAGLLAACVLSKHFKRIVIVERDALDQDSLARRGVPQGRHLHGLLKRGEQIMSGLFPDFVPALLARGATLLRFGEDLRWYHFGCWKQRYESSVAAIALSRPVLEHEIRRRVRELPNISLMDRTVVTRYVGDREHTRLTGVGIRARDDDTLETEIAADLIVDACGRGSQTPARLASLGYSPPPEERLKIDVAYATRVYEQAPGARTWKALIVMEDAPAIRSGLIFPIEGNRWIVTLIGRHGVRPPTDEAGFVAYAKSLPMPDVYQAISAARPLSNIVPHGFATSQRRYYERATRFPARLIVMGDALCSFNPIFGQGMTVSAMQAELLHNCFDELSAGRTSDLNALTESFRKRVGNTVNAAWEMTTAEDLRLPQTPGRRTLKLRFMHWYTARIHRAAGHSKLVAERFYHVMNMLAPATTLFGRDVLSELLRMSCPTDNSRHVSDGHTSSY